MKIAVGTAHLTVVNIPEKGVERRSNQGKGGKNNACLHPRSSKSFVYQPISTKFYKKVALGTSHIRKVEVPKKSVRQGSNWQKGEKNHVFDIPGALKFLFTHRDLGGATSNVGRPKCLATTVWPWRPYLSSALADEFSSLIFNVNCQP
jgi:hypothetical protein